MADQPTPNATPATDGDAGKLQAELAKLQAETAKVAADARAAETAALKAAREELEAATPAAVKRREAVAEKDAAEAMKNAAAARQQQVAALIPDLSKVTGGALELKEGQPMATTAIAHKALGVAAGQVVEQVLKAMKPKAAWRVLITSDAQLATSDASYHDVTSALDELTSAAGTLLDKTQADKAQAQDLGASAVLAGLAGAVPGVLSLLSAKRTLTSAAVTVQDLTAAAAVAGGLKATVAEGKVFHDAFRLMPADIVKDKVEALADVRRQMAARRIELAAARDAAAAEQAAATNALAVLLEQLAKGGDEGALEDQIAQERANVDDASGALSASSARLAIVESALKETEEFSKALHTVPEGATRSPLAEAALREQLHGGDSRFTHVLLVGSHGGSAVQTIEDKPLWFNDRYSLIGAVTISYMLLELPEGDVVAAGHRNGTAAVRGKIGELFDIDVR